MFNNKFHQEDERYVFEGLTKIENGVLSIETEEYAINDEMPSLTNITTIELNPSLREIAITNSDGTMSTLGNDGLAVGAQTSMQDIIPAGTSVGRGEILLQSVSRIQRKLYWKTLMKTLLTY